VLVTESDVRYERTSMATGRSALPWSGFTLVGLTRPVWPVRRIANHDATAARERPARNRPSWVRTHSRSTANVVGRGFATTAWNTGSPSSFGAPYAPTQQIGISAIGGRTAVQVSTAGALVSTYYAAPQYTLGYGGNANAVAALQSVYSIKSGTRCVSKPC